MTEPVTFPFDSVDSKRAKAGVIGFLSIPAARVAMEALGSCDQEGNMSAIVVPLSLLNVFTDVERAIIAVLK